MKRNKPVVRKNPKLKKWLNSKSASPLYEDRPSALSRGLGDSTRLLYPHNPDGLSIYELQRLRGYKDVVRKRQVWWGSDGHKTQYAAGFYLEVRSYSVRFYGEIMKARSRFHGLTRRRVGGARLYKEPQKFISDMGSVKYLPHDSHKDLE